MDIEELHRKAEAGSCVAQSVLGISYLYGHDVQVDYKQAFKFLSDAAAQGVSRAVLNLGYIYAKGLGIAKDVPEAVRLFEAVGKPQESSDAFVARMELGRIYSSGADVPVDVSKALYWYTAAIALSKDGDDSDDVVEAKAYVARETNAETNQSWHRFRDAINSSSKLLQRDEYEEALKLLDESIAEAIRGNQVSWVRTLSHHAAVISKFAGNLQLVKHYYEQSLAFNPDNPRALYGLAEVAREQGETEIARQYAFRCHRAIEESEDEIAKQALLELLVRHWPEVAGK
jgi:tetratricopeptide (TPR) repeat protein